MASLVLSPPPPFQPPYLLPPNLCLLICSIYVQVAQHQFTKMYLFLQIYAWALTKS